MLWEVFGSTLLGLATAFAARKWLARWFPARVLPLMMATGPVAGLLGGLIARVVLGPHHLAAALLVALGVSVALLSLLVRPTDRAKPHGITHEGPDRSRARVHTGAA